MHGPFGVHPIEFFEEPDVRTQMPDRNCGTSWCCLSKTKERGTVHIKVSVQQIPGLQSRTSPRPGPCLAAQCEITPHIAQHLFEIVSQRGVSHPFALLSCGIAQVSLRYPFLGGSIAPPLRMLSKGETVRKGGGGITPNWPCWGTKTP